MRVYIAGKITDCEEAKQRFEAAAAWLQNQGCDVISPYAIGTILPVLEHEDYMHISFALIDVADAVYFLGNWRESCGASQEMGYAIAKGKKLYFEVSE